MSPHPNAMSQREFEAEVARLSARLLGRALSARELLAALELWTAGWTPYAAAAQVFPR